MGGVGSRPQRAPRGLPPRSSAVKLETIGGDGKGSSDSHANAVAGAPDGAPSEAPATVALSSRAAGPGGRPIRLSKVVPRPAPYQPEYNDVSGLVFLKEYQDSMLRENVWYYRCGCASV